MLKWLGGIVIGALLGAGTVLLLRHELTDVEHATPAGSPTEEPHPVEQHVPLRDPTVGETAPRETPATLADTQRLASSFEQKVALLDLLGSSDPRTMEALLDEARTLARLSPSREFVEHAIYTRYAELDPLGALGRMVARRCQLVGPARIDRAVLPRPTPTGVLNYVDSLGEPRRMMLAGTILREAKGRDDIQNAVAERFSLHRELDRARALEAVDTDPAGAWHAALSLDAGSRPGSLYLVATQWARSDPTAAFDAAAALADTQLRDRVESAVASEWMRADRDAALDRVLTLPPSSHREAIAAALNTLAQTDPEAALASLVDLNDRILIQRHSSRMAWRWVSYEPQAAYDWAFAQASSEMPSELIHPVMYTIALSSHRRRPFARIPPRRRPATHFGVQERVRDLGTDRRACCRPMARCLAQSTG